SVRNAQWIVWPETNLGSYRVEFLWERLVSWTLAHVRSNVFRLGPLIVSPLKSRYSTLQSRILVHLSHFQPMVGESGARHGSDAQQVLRSSSNFLSVKGCCFS